MTLPSYDLTYVRSSLLTFPYYHILECFTSDSDIIHKDWLGVFVRELYGKDFLYCREFHNQ